MTAPQITTFYDPPLLTDAPDVFDLKAQAMGQAQQAVGVETNTVSTFVNTKAVEADSSATTALGYRNTAQTYRNEAQSARGDAIAAKNAAEVARDAAFNSVTGDIGAAVAAASEISSPNVSDFLALSVGGVLRKLKISNLTAGLGFGTAATKDAPTSGNASASQVVMGDDTRLSDSRQWTASTVSQAEAETGTATTARKWTAQRVRQAITGWWSGITATDIPNLPASKITSGTFAAARIPTLNQNTTGNAATATQLATARTIGGVSFNGKANINLPGVNTTGNQNTTGSAATLTTARNINGTSFNGSASITTANWGTARTLTIGSSAKSVNGSGNVTWTGKEIGYTRLARSTSATLGEGQLHHLDAGITIPTVANGAPPVGSIIPVFLSASTRRTVTPATGVTLRHSGTETAGPATIEKRGSYTLAHVNTNEWVIIGDLV